MGLTCVGAAAGKTRALSSTHIPAAFIDGSNSRTEMLRSLGRLCQLFADSEVRGDSIHFDIRPKREGATQLCTTNVDFANRLVGLRVTQTPAFQ